MSPETHEKATISRWKYALIFAVGTLFSRLLGLVRDILMGWYVPDFSRDTFLFAFRLPNTFRDLLGEGAVNASFVPVLSEYKEKGGIEEMRKLTNSLFSTMFVILIVVSVFGVLFMPFIPNIIDTLHTITKETPKTEEQLNLAVLILQWCFPYLFWIGIAVFMMAPLFILGDYKTPGMAPALLNISLIICIFIPYFLQIDIIWSLVIGLWLGGILQAVVLFLAIWKRLRAPTFTKNWYNEGVRKAFLLLLPVIFGQAAGEINKLVDSFFSYSLPEGTVSALFYANRLIQLPLAIFGTAISVSILPELSKYFANKEIYKIKQALREGTLQTLFMILPTMVILILLSKPTVKLLFERGHFGAELTEKTAHAIIIYSIGVIGFSGVKVLIQGFYAMNNTSIPVIISSISMILNIILNIILVGPLGYIGLVLSTAISFWVNFLSLFVILSFRLGNLVNKEYLLNIMKYVISIFFIIGIFFIINMLVNLNSISGTLKLGLYVFFMGSTCFTLYLFIAWLLGIKEINQVLYLVLKK
ncbi:MAG: murein biosynthesis integral membrane protein MurJ [Candidatus Hydrogenedens sp.]|nr:murein biosynthesis integral membrane protein MurJ [Candidatus Hydrogenedens sp.]